MMKHLFFMAALLLSQVAVAQETLPTDGYGAVQFQQVVTLDSGRTAKSISNQARQWAAKAYNSAASVIQEFDPEQGILILKAVAPINTTIAYRAMGKQTETPVGYRLNYTLAIETKKGRYRATLDQLMLEGATGNGAPSMKVPVPSIASSIDQNYERIKDVKMMSEKAKRANAELNYQNQTFLMQQVRAHCTSLLNDLKTNLTSIKAEKDW